MVSFYRSHPTRLDSDSASADRPLQSSVSPTPKQQRLAQGLDGDLRSPEPLQDCKPDKDQPGPSQPSQARSWPLPVHCTGACSTRLSAPAALFAHTPELALRLPLCFLGWLFISVSSG